VVLYDGDGCFLKELWTLAQYDWRLVWDRHDPNLLYTWKSGNLYRYNVQTDMAELLMSFAPLGISPAGPSVNQAGDRILVLTSDGTFHSYHLPDMQDERAFQPGFPAGCKPGSENKERYIGYRNYIVTRYSPSGGPATMYIYDDTGVLFHRFDGLGHGHADFSPDGQFAYPKMPKGEGPRGSVTWSPLEVHVVNIDGTNDRVLYSVPKSQATYIQNFHITWPKGVTGWFVVSLFPSALSLPATYAPPLDEVMKISVDGTPQFLGRTGTADSTFWAQPLASPSSDGTRICFNSNRSGTIDLCILFPLLITSRSPLPDGRVGAAYEQTLTATGGTTPYTWSLTAGALPDGVALSPAGLLSGQPAEAGTFSLVMQVTDHAGVQTSERFSLTITPPASVLTAGDFREVLNQDHRLSRWYEEGL